MASGGRTGRLALVATGAIILVVAALLYVFKLVLLPLMVSGLLAFLLRPVVERVESLMPWRSRWPNLSRLSSILLIYIVTLGVIAGSLLLIVPPLYQETVKFIESIPALYADIETTAEQWNQQLVVRIPQEIRQRVQDALARAGDALMVEIQDVIAGTVRSVPGIFTVIIGLAAIPILLFYLMKDRETLAEGMYGPFPSAIQPHLSNIIDIAGQVIGSYIRAQLTLGFVVGSMAFVGLSLLEIEFAVLLGIVAGITELIPIIGPWLGAIAGILVTLATAPEKVLWVILLYLGIQILENVLLVPRVQGNALNIHPLWMIVIILVGAQIAGLWGVILGPPLVAAGKGVISYFANQWNRPTPSLEVESVDGRRKPFTEEPITVESIRPREDGQTDQKE
jgi:predicted PurR-regulated permease PerM